MAKQAKPFTCHDCKAINWLFFYEFKMHTRPRCTSCGSVALDPPEYKPALPPKKPKRRKPRASGGDL